METASAVRISEWAEKAAHSNGDGYGDGYGDGDGYGYGDGDGNGYGDGYGNGNGYGDGSALLCTGPDLSDVQATVLGVVFESMVVEF